MLASNAFAQSAALEVATPPGWSRQEDPRSHAVFLKPPDSPSINEAGLVVFPPVPVTGSAQQFHRQTLATAVAQGRLLGEPRQRNAGDILITSAHCQSAQGGEIFFVLYTVVREGRGQAALFATTRQDLFQNDGPAASRAVTQSAGSRNAPAAAPAAANPVGPPDSLAPNPPASGTAAATTESGPAAAANPDILPQLEYTDPPNFFRGAARRYAEYTSSEVNYTLCVYPFRPFTGDIVGTFKRTLLRDWIDLQYKEENVAGPPAFSNNTMPGATTVIDARFHENIVGLANERLRVLVVAGNMAALIDAKAPNAFCWNKAAPSVQAMLASLRVGQKPAPPSLAGGPGPGGAALAGLYMGTKAKFMAIGLVDYTGHKPALHFFLFSADGRVFRCYDTPPAGGDWRLFDFNAAERSDPGNTGRFAVRGNELYIRMGGTEQDEISATATEPGVLVLDSVRYARRQ